jgi:hypothetical protein
MRSMRDDEPRPVWTSCPSRTWSSRLGIEPKTPGWLVQDRTTSPSARGIWRPPSLRAGRPSDRGFGFQKLDSDFKPDCLSPGGGDQARWYHPATGKPLIRVRGKSSPCRLLLCQVCMGKQTVAW